MERLFASITLRLFNFDQLIVSFGFDAIKVKVKAFDLFNAFESLDEHRNTNWLDMDCHLEVILLLADKRVVSVTKVKTFVGVDPIIRWRSAIHNQKSSV